MKKILTLSLLILIFIFSSCRKDVAPAVKNTLMPKLIGNWRLVEVYCGWGSEENVDSNKSTLTFYENGLFHSDNYYFAYAGYYTLKSETWKNNTDTVIYFNNNGFGIKPYFISSDTLSLRFYNCNDCNGYFLTRKK